MRTDVRQITFGFLVFGILLIQIAFLQSLSYAQKPTGLEIMTRVDERDDGEDQRATAIFQLINKKEQKRVRKATRLWKDYHGKEGFDAKLILFFESPPDVKGTGFLNWSYVDEEKDDDQWLYLPALGEVRRVSASEKGDSFMDTDFTYHDMGERKVEEDTHTLLRSEVLRDTDCYVVESVPKKKGYIYSKKITWVDKTNWVPLKVDYYDSKDRFLKTLTVEWQKQDGIWSWKQAEMKNHLTEQTTSIEIQNVKINTGISDTIFTKSTLEEGIDEEKLKSKKVVLPYDKGPSTIDVSEYPKEMQDIYKNAFMKRCSKCHTIARAINAPYTTPEEWKRYIKKMMKKPGSGVNPNAAKKIYKFLVYDSKIRKKGKEEKK